MINTTCSCSDCCCCTLFILSCRASCSAQYVSTYARTYVIIDTSSSWGDAALCSGAAYHSGREYKERWFTNNSMQRSLNYHPEWYLVSRLPAPSTAVYVRVRILRRASALEWEIHLSEYSRQMRTSTATVLANSGKENWKFVYFVFSLCFSRVH